jgi:hypothetical protein
MLLPSISNGLLMAWVESLVWIPYSASFLFDEATDLGEFVLGVVAPPSSCLRSLSLLEWGFRSIQESG